MVVCGVGFSRVTCSRWIMLVHSLPHQLCMIIKEARVRRNGSVMKGEKWERDGKVVCAGIRPDDVTGLSNVLHVLTRVGIVLCFCVTACVLLA